MEISKVRNERSPPPEKRWRCEGKCKSKGIMGVYSLLAHGGMVPENAPLEHMEAVRFVICFHAYYIPKKKVKGKKSGFRRTRLRSLGAQWQNKTKFPFHSALSHIQALKNPIPSSNHHTP